MIAWVARAAFAALLLLVACAATGAGAQASSDEHVVRTLDDRERIAALNRDVPQLEALWSEQFTVNAPNNQVVVGRQRNLDTFVRSGIIDFSKFERSIEFIRVDGDFGVIMGLETVVAAPAPIEMQRGVTQRLRFIAIPANGEYVVRLLRDGSPVMWTAVARDGAELRAHRRHTTPASTRVDVGITRDFEFTPDEPGELMLVIDHRIPGHPTQLTIRVR